MAELGIAIPPLASQILKTVNEISKLYANVRDAPKQWESHKHLMTRLSDELEVLRQGAEESNGSAPIKFSKADHDQIERVLVEYKAFLDKHQSCLTAPGASGAAARAAWFVNKNRVEELQGYQDKVNSIYIQIIEPCWRRHLVDVVRESQNRRDLDLGQRRPESPRSPPDRAPTASMETYRPSSWSSSGGSSCWVIKERVGGISDGITDTNNAAAFAPLPVMVRLYVLRHIPHFMMKIL